MKVRLVFISIILTAILLVSTAAGGLYWILQQSPLFLLGNNTSSESAAAMFVPRQAAMMVSLLVNPDRLEVLQQLKTPIGKRRRLHRELNQVKKTLLASTGLDYGKDIQPWLGSEITLAVTSLDFDRQPDNGVQPGYLLVLEAKDPELAKEFLQLSFSRQAIAGTSDLVFETYKGVNLIYKGTETPENTTFTSGVVGNYVLLANHPKVLRSAINNVQVPDLNLKSAPYYQEALSAIEEARVGIAFFNLPYFSAWSTSTEVPETPETQQMLTLALDLKSQGLTAETALIGVTDPENLPPALVEPVKALQYVPSDSILTLAGTDLNGLWEQFQTGLAPASPLSQLVNRSLTNLAKPFALDFPRDIFSWVEGEYALSLFPNADTHELNWIFVTENKSAAKFELGIESLDKLAQERELNESKFRLGDRNITAWTQVQAALEEQEIRLDTKIKGVHVREGNYEIFSNNLGALANVLNGEDNSLLSQENFQNAIASLPTENDGYLYIDWQKGNSTFEQKFPPLQILEFVAQPLFNHLNQLTFVSQGRENGISHGTIFFNVQ